MPMHNLLACSNNYSKISRSLWQYYRDKPNGNLRYSESFKPKERKTGSTLNDGNTKRGEIAAPLKYLSHFWRTLEMPLIICEINLILI